MKTYMPLNGLRWSRDSGSVHCNMPGSVVFGRSGGGNINGLVALYANDFKNHYAYVSLVAVDSDFRNQGIASNLLVQAINHVRGLGVDKIQKIGIYTNNHIALHLYETLNFCRISVSQDRYYLELSL